jgi:hypothetical protein
MELVRISVKGGLPMGVEDTEEPEQTSEKTGPLMDGAASRVPARTLERVGSVTPRATSMEPAKTLAGASSKTLKEIYAGPARTSEKAGSMNQNEIVMELIIAKLDIRSRFSKTNADEYFLVAEDQDQGLWHSKYKSTDAREMYAFLHKLKARGWIDADKWDCVRKCKPAIQMGNRTRWAEDQAEPQKYGSQRSRGLSWSTHGVNTNTYEARSDDDDPQA